jgi:predicted nucleic acid-binding Zn ribbon protein
MADWDDVIAEVTARQERERLAIQRRRDRDRHFAIWCFLITVAIIVIGVPLVYLMTLLGV